MIKASNIGVKFDDWIFRGIDLQINEGEIIGVIGRSGIGKTTLLKALAGLIDLEEGDVSFKGKKLIGPSEKLIPGYEDIQLVNQDFALEPYHTVEQNIKEKILHLHAEDRDALIKELLDLVELTAIKDRQARLLSGGEQQRLAIARALASEPEFLLLDEPFVHLDQRLRLEIVDYILELHKVRKMTIVIVSHDGAELMGVVSRVVHVDQSGVRRIAPIQEMYYLPESEDQGVLMGPINSLNINGQELLFRPNEFEVGDEVKVQYLHSIDTGMIVFNYFMVNDEKIMLSSSESLVNVTGINILKRA